MGVFASTDDPDRRGHEQVVFCQDKPAACKAIIGIYSTALGPGARRHPLLPVRQRGGRARRRARPVPRHGVQERARRAGPRRRQGRHLGRPGADQERGAAARVRPVRRVARRPLLHRLRRRHLRRRHGRRRPGDPVRHRPQRRARRRRRLLDPHRLGRLPGHAGRGRARLGHADAARPAGRRRRASARSASTWSSTCSRTAPTVVATDVNPRRRWPGSAPTHPQVDAGRRHRPR